MKTLNLVLVVAGVVAFAPSTSVWAAESSNETCSCGTDGSAGVAPEMMVGGGKASLSHARARAAKAEAVKAAELRAAKCTDKKAGEKPAPAAPVVIVPVKTFVGGGKSSAAHARARDTKATAKQAAAQNAE